MKNSFNRKKSYLRAGILYEYSGALKISLKIYFISLKTFYFKSKINARLFCCFHWINLLRKRSFNLIKKHKLLNCFNNDSLSFFLKYYQYSGSFILAIDLLKKNKGLIHLGLILKRFNCNVYIFGNIIRLILLTNNNFLDMSNIRRLFHKIKKKHGIKKKELWIINRSLINFKNKFRRYNTIKNILHDLGNKEKKFNQPLLMKTILESNCVFDEKKKKIVKLSEYIVSDLKLYLNEYKNSSFSFLKFQQTSFPELEIFCSFLIFNDTYSHFIRNLNDGLKFLMKCKNNTQKFILKIFKKYALLEKRDIEPYFLFSKIQKKLGLKKNPLGSVLFIPTSNVKKKLVNFNKEYILKLNIVAERFYEKKKVNILLKIYLILVLINFKLSLVFKRGENYKKIIFHDVFKKKNLNKKLSNLKSDVMIKFMNTNENLVLLYKILVYKLIKKKNILKKFVGNKIIDIIISNKIFSKLNSFNLRPLFILWMLKKKKYVKAYNLLRLQCSIRPYSFQSWQVLSLVEKEIGIAVSKTLRFTLRIVGKFPNSIPGIIFAGNLCSVFGSSGYALAEFYQAYRWKNNSPFLNLSIAIQYLNGSINRRNISKGIVILLSLCFFFRYKILRYFTIQIILQENFFSHFLDLEILYNSARILLFLGINYRAKTDFETVFKIKKSVSKSRKFNRNNKKYKESIELETEINLFLFE
jgi:hypothetical protein